MTQQGPMPDLLFLTQRLLELLEAEMQAIAAHDTPRMESLREHKAQVVEALERHPAHPHPLSEATRATLIRCREQNRRNGALLEMRRRHADRVLRILHGISDAGTVYDDQGMARTLPTSRYRIQA
jgi:flagellar biosynthesis/type III secretory pathway chaperone